MSTALQNTRLLTETQRRLTEVNLLLEFSLKLSSLQSENILSVLLHSLRVVLPQAQAGWVGLLDEQGGVIKQSVHQVSIECEVTALPENEKSIPLVK